MRIDLLLYRLRFARSRARAASLVACGSVRLNGERVLRASRQVAPGDVVTLPVASPIAGGVRAIRIVSLPDRRGPATEAREHYRDARNAQNP